MKAIAQHRDLFRDNVFQWRTDDGQHIVVKFLFALISPLAVVFAPLQPVIKYAPWQIGPIDVDAPYDPHPRLHWLVDFQQYRMWFELALVPLDRITTVGGVRYLGGTTLGSSEQWEPLATVLTRYGPVKEPSKKQTKTEEETWWESEKTCH